MSSRPTSPGFFHEPQVPQASKELEELRAREDYTTPFEVIRRRVVDDSLNGRVAIDAIVVVKIGAEEELEAARGVGGVHALDLALRKVLTRHFPSIAGVRVTESYNHGSGEGTEAEVISVKKFTDGKNQWSTMRKSTDIVEAGWLSLLDGYEWKVWMERKKSKNARAEP
ncbi:MAG: alpha-isopropylmalate synthase regulatory domain-containing protein [Candidatus Binatia bacterium]